MEDYNKTLKTDISPWFFVQLFIVNLFGCMLFGFVLQCIFDLPFWIVYFLYLTSGSLFYFVHWLGHKNWIEVWYRAHVVGHHVYAYNSRTFLSEKYVVNWYDKYDLNTYMYAVAGVCYLLVFWYVTGYDYLRMGIIIMCMYLILMVEEYVHQEYHLKDSKLDKYEWFRKLRWIHYLHHSGDLQRNYAMKDFLIDIVTGNMNNA
jgi:hypothetical protein